MSSCCIPLRNELIHPVVAIGFYWIFNVISYIMYFICISYNQDEESKEGEDEEEEEEVEIEIFSVLSTSEPEEEVSADEEGYANEDGDVQVKIEDADRKMKSEILSREKTRMMGVCRRKKKWYTRRRMMNLLQMTVTMVVKSLVMRLLPKTILNTKSLLPCIATTKLQWCILQYLVGRR